MAKPLFNKALAVGVLVAVAFTAFLVAYTFFRKGGFSERDSYAVHAYFADATGLTWKSRVQIAGIQVGEVEQIVLEGQRARLQLRIKNEIDLRADACISKRFPSALLPDALLDAVPGTPQAPSLRDAPEAEREVKCVNEAAGVAKLLDSLQKISTDISAVTGELAETLRGERGSIRQIMDNLAKASATLDRAMAEDADKVGRLGRSEQQGLEFVSFGAASYTFKNNASLALTAAYIADLDATINGARAPGSGRAATRLGVALGVPFASAYRVSASLSGDLPIRALGLNQPAGIGLGVILIRSWS